MLEISIRRGLLVYHINPCEYLRLTCHFATEKARSRRFAERLGTWFRSLSDCRFFDLAGEEVAEAVTKQPLLKVRNRHVAQQRYLAC
jgi:hypothetical protein